MFTFFNLNSLSRCSFIFCSAVIILPILGIVFLTTQIVFDEELFDSLVYSLLSQYTVNTLILCVGTGFIAFTFSVPTAWILSRYNFLGKKIIEVLAILPMAMPAYIMAYAYTDAFDYSGWISIMVKDYLFSAGIINDPILERVFWPEIRSMPGACFILGVALSPYLILLARGAFQKRQIQLIEAAMGMGVSSYRIFFKVVLPLARPAIIAGLSLILMECLSDYGTVSYFSVQTLSTGLYKAWLGYGDVNIASIIAVVIFCFALFLIISDKYLSSSQYKLVEDEKSSQNFLKIGGIKTLSMIFISSLSGIFGFIVPFTLLLKAAADHFLFSLTPLDNIDKEVFWSSLNSLFLASGSLIIIIFFSWIVAFTLRQNNSKIMLFIVEILCSTYAIAGLVLALSLLTLSGFLSNLIFLVSGINIIFTTSSFILFLAYVSRFFAVGFKPINSRYYLISKNIDFSAQSMGLSPTEIFSRLHLPLLWQASLIAGTLVFLDVLKELPATLVLRPLDFETLAISAYGYANDENLGMAAIPSLVLVTLAIIPIAILANELKKLSR